MSLPQTANMLSIKTSLHYYHKDDETKYWSAYTGKSGAGSGKIYNKNVKAYNLLYNNEQIEFKNLEIVEIWCKDLSEREWRKLNPEVVDSMCCLLNPAPWQYKIHFFKKKGNKDAQAFTYSTMIFRIILHCENATGMWQGTLPIRVNTRSQATKDIWVREGMRHRNANRKKNGRSEEDIEEESSSDSDGDANHGSIRAQLMNGPVFSHQQQYTHQQSHHQQHMQQQQQMLHVQQNVPIVYNQAPPMQMSTDDMIINGANAHSD